MINMGLTDHTRLTLCMFMFAILSFNPFGIIFKKFSNSEMEGKEFDTGRTILNTEGIINFVRPFQIFFFYLPCD